jgi:hypothetical protein
MVVTLIMVSNFVISGFKEARAGKETPSTISILSFLPFPALPVTFRIKEAWARPCFASTPVESFRALCYILSNIITNKIIKMD